jgi:hypothetical protein
VIVFEGFKGGGLGGGDNVEVADDELVAGVGVGGFLELVDFDALDVRFEGGEGSNGGVGGGKDGSICLIGNKACDFFVLVGGGEVAELDVNGRGVFVGGGNETEAASVEEIDGFVLLRGFVDGEGGGGVKRSLSASGRVRGG